MAATLQPVVLVIIDGWGIAPSWGGNAISLAKIPVYNQLVRGYPNTLLGASGVAVGLPENEKGNSEVGHLNIGAGQVVHESLTSISQAITDGSFFTNQPLNTAFDRVKQADSALHLIGLVSDGGVHSHIDHLFALIDMAKKKEISKLYIHAITDGRDTPPFVAQHFLSQTEEKLRQVGIGQICSVTGRYFAMDRDRRWDRIEKFYRAITEGVGRVSPSVEAAVAQAYREGVSDEFIPPTIINGEGKMSVPIRDGDELVCFNFRADRSRELAHALISDKFSEFNRRITLKDIKMTAFTFYQEDLPVAVAFRPRDVHYPLSRVLSEAGLRHLHVAESEKYAHVTYFFNGGEEKPFPGEQRIVIPSPKVATYDQTPEMSTAQLAQAVVENMSKYAFTVCNIAAPDMIAHTGNLRATVIACEATDQALGQIYNQAKKDNAIMLITADHGNAEQLVDPKTGEPDTEHNNGPVPFIVVGESARGWKLRQNGVLADIAPTILNIFNLSQPSEMTGQTLILQSENTTVGQGVAPLPSGNSPQ